MRPTVATIIANVTAIGKRNVTDLSDKRPSPHADVRYTFGIDARVQVLLRSVKNASLHDDGNNEKSAQAQFLAQIVQRRVFYLLTQKTNR